MWAWGSVVLSRFTTQHSKLSSVRTHKNTQELNLPLPLAKMLYSCCCSMRRKVLDAWPANTSSHDNRVQSAYCAPVDVRQMLHSARNSFRSNLDLDAADRIGLSNDRDQCGVSAGCRQLAPCSKAQGSFKPVGPNCSSARHCVEPWSFCMQPLLHSNEAKQGL